MSEHARYYVTTNLEGTLEKPFKNVDACVKRIREYFHSYVGDEIELNILGKQRLYSDDWTSIILYREDSRVGEFVAEIWKQEPVHVFEGGQPVYDMRTPEEMHMSNLLHECREKLFINLKKVCDSDGGQSTCDSFIDSLREDLSIFLDKYVFEYSGDDAEEYFKTLRMPEETK